MPKSSKGSPTLYHSQYTNHSDSNTSWTPGEPSEVPLGTSTTTSAIKIGGVTFFFLAFGWTPLQPLVWDPCSTTPLLTLMPWHQKHGIYFHADAHDDFKLTIWPSIVSQKKYSFLDSINLSYVFLWDFLFWYDISFFGREGGEGLACHSLKNLPTLCNFCIYSSPLPFIGHWKSLLKIKVTA